MLNSIRPILVASVAACALLGGCAPVDVRWSCPCSGTCDGEPFTTSWNPCNPDDDRTGAEHAAEGYCRDGLSEGCASFTCTCECSPSDGEC